MKNFQDIKYKILTRENLYFLIIIFFVFFLDRYSKILIIKELSEKTFFVNDFLNLNLIWNTGIGFGLLSSNSELIYNSGKVTINFSDKNIHRHSGTVDFVAAGIKTGDVFTVGAAGSLGAAVVSAVVGVHTVSIASTNDLVFLGSIVVLGSFIFCNKRLKWVPILLLCLNVVANIAIGVYNFVEKDVLCNSECVQHCETLVNYGNNFTIFIHPRFFFK